MQSCCYMYSLGIQCKQQNIPDHASYSYSVLNRSLSYICNISFLEVHLERVASSICIMDQWLYSISDHCFDDLTNYRQNCYSSIVDGIGLLPTSNAAHFHILRVFHQVKQWIGEADNMEAKDWGWSIEHNMCVPLISYKLAIHVSFKYQH
jgi:hypothetical protein